MNVTKTLLFCLTGHICLCLVVFCGSASLHAQAIHNSQSASSSQHLPDVLIFSNGDQLTGKLLQVKIGTVIFSSDGAGTLKIPWSKIKELRSDQSFAVLVTSARVRRHHVNQAIPVGTLNMVNQKVTVHSAKGDQTLPVTNIAYIVDASTFTNDVEHTPGLLHGWAGSATGGASLVKSTQNVTTYNSAITLTHSVPMVEWLPSDNRTQVAFTSTYGKISQANTPTITTNILHGLLEQDKYFSARFYLLTHAIYDHNNTQGLDLQQTYGGGFGYSVIKKPKQTLDVTATVDYTKQQFQVASSNQNLIGSTFANSYMCKLPRKAVLTEISSITPEWNNMNAFSANASVGVALPIFKKFSFTMQFIDSYLNNPPPTFEANSEQFNTGITYTLP